MYVCIYLSCVPPPYHQAARTLTLRRATLQRRLLDLQIAGLAGDVAAGDGAGELAGESSLAGELAGEPSLAGDSISAAGAVEGSSGGGGGAAEAEVCCPRVFICMYTYMFACIYIYTYIHTHIYIYI